MTSQCTAPDLQMTLLEVARSTDAFEPILAEHLEACSACQTAVERLQRMLGAWSAEGADNEAISAAAARFAARGLSPRGPSYWQSPISFALLGATLGVALLVAVHATRPATVAGADATLPKTSVKEPANGTAQGSSPSVSREEKAPAPATPHIEGPHGVMTLADGLRLELKVGESAHVALSDGQSTDLQGPCVVVFWSSPTQVGGWRLSRQPVEGSAIALVEPGPERSLPEPASTLPATKRAWAIAAEALRKDDFAAADEAFAQLGRDSDAATRDAARLARAQLWIAHGRAAEVRAVLEDLAQNGATSLVRQRAAEFLSRK